MLPAINAPLCFVLDTQDLVSKLRLLLSRPRVLLQLQVLLVSSGAFFSASRSILEIGYPTLTQTRLDPPLLSRVGHLTLVSASKGRTILAFSPILFA